MSRKWIFASFILLFLISAAAFTYDVNSESISREKITSTDIKSEEIDIGIELEKEIKEGDSFTTTITIPIADIDAIDRELQRWAIEQEDLFFKNIKTMDPSLSKHAEASFVIEPIVKRVKKNFLTYEMHTQSYIEDEFNDVSYHDTDIASFVIHTKDETLVQLDEIVNIPDIKNKSEYTRFLSMIPDGKEKERLEKIDTKTIDTLNWSLNEKSLEFLVDNKENKNEVDRIFIDFKHIEKHLTKPYKKQFIPKKKKKKPKKEVKKKETNQKLIAITFDDGPNPYVTPRILDILKTENVKATFFMLARNVKANPNVAKSVVDHGHEIANHSETHANLNKAKKSQIEREVVHSKKIIEETIGVSPTLFRPPYGEYNSVVLDYANKSDQQLIMWSVDTLDWEHKNKNKTVELAMSRSQSQSIILMHDIHDTTADALSNLIHRLKNENYQFVTVSELMQYLDPASNGVYYGR